jgi:hypothetical protein
MSQPKIFPRNLTAQAAYLPAGNPVSTRLESAIGNCYPGLEIDARNLECRFFPGLRFDFVDESDFDTTPVGGIRLNSVDRADPELSGGDPRAPALAKALENAEAKLSQGQWYLTRIVQDGKGIDVSVGGEPLQGMRAWMLVRGLEPDASVVVTLTNAAKESVEFAGWRRRYVDRETGVISAAYAPGELSQSLCSPWTHDFRDCGCTYWSSNHPDVALPPVPAGAATGADGNALDPSLRERVNWLRSNRTSLAPALADRAGNRLSEMDYGEINQRWHELPFVLEGRELNGPYVNYHGSDAAKPYATAKELARSLGVAAAVEHAVALEYLYAYFSVVAPESVQGDQSLYGLAVFLRRNLLLIAVSEMMHIRWANQLLWELTQHGLTPARPYTPQLTPSAKVPYGADMRPASLRPLTRGLVEDFLAIESSHGIIDTLYSRVVATLRLPHYPRRLQDVAQRIVGDGLDHFGRFAEIQRAIDPNSAKPPAIAPPDPFGDQTPWLRPIRLATAEQAAAALDSYAKILSSLKEAYSDDARAAYADSVADVVAGRAAMSELLARGEELAARGLGIPFPFPAT